MKGATFNTSRHRFCANKRADPLKPWSDNRHGFAMDWFAYLLECNCSLLQTMALWDHRLCIYSSFVFVAGVFSTAKVLALNTATSAATHAGYSIGGRLALQALEWVSGPGEQKIPEVTTLEKFKQIPAAFQFVPAVDKLRLSCSILAVVFPRLIR